MTLRITLALSLLAAAPAFAQPAAKPPAPRPTPAAKPAPTTDATVDELAAFDHELDALFSSGGLTSDQAAGRAAGASPTVRRKVAEIDAAVAQADAAAIARVPQVSLKASYTRLSHIDPFIIPLQLPNGQTVAPIESFQNAWLGEAQLVVPLSDYLIRFPKLVESADLAVKASQLDRRANEISAGEDARVAYFEWVRAKLQLLVAQRQLVQVQRTLDQERALAEVQRVSKADLMRVESQAAEAEQNVYSLTNISQLREEQLRILIGAGSEQLVIGEDIRADLGAPGASHLDDLMVAAKQQRLEFKQLETGIAAKESQRSAEKANLYPRVSAFGVADYADPNQREFPQRQQFDLTWQAGVQATWTINDMLTSRTTDHRLAAEAAQLRADKENLERSTRIEVLQAQQAVVLAQQSLITSQKGLASAQESYRVRRELLAADRATAVELVDSETDLTRARIAALNAHVDLREARAQLDHALGNDTKPAAR
jgi:outer membrane protein